MGPGSNSPQPTPSAVAEELLAQLSSHADAHNVAGMARFGISSSGTLGIAMPVVRSLASEGKRQLGRDSLARHELAGLLWDSGLHEARIMAALVDEPSLVTPEQADAWVAQVDSWDVCDQLCIKLFRHCGFAWEKAVQWTQEQPLFVKRAGFSLCATLAVHEKGAADEAFAPMLRAVEREATDERSLVKKAVNWALRQIGKRDRALNALAIACCQRILAENPDSSSARWIARDALRELSSSAVQQRLLG